MSSTSCISCGYSLAGLAREALCPECAFPVARSLDATLLLRTADPRWLVRVASGLRALNRSMRCWLIAVAIWVVSMFVAIFVMKGVGSDLAFTILIILAVLMMLAASAGFLLAAYGFWAAAAPTPSFHAPPRWARLMMRYLASPLAVLAVVIAAFSTIASINVLGDPVVYASRASLQVVGLLSLLAFSRILQHFELSLPDPRHDLAKRSRATRRWLTVVAILFLVGWCQIIFGTRMVTPMPLGFAPILLTIGFLSFERTVNRTHAGIAAELATAKAEGGMLKSS